MSITKIFNKTFFEVVCLLMIIATIGVLFTGCGLGKLNGGPNKDDEVTGNGSLAVTKGEYLYFVNGYKGIDDIGDTNHFGKIEQAGIYRIKLDSEGKVTEDTKYDEDNEVIYDKTKSLKNIDILVSKIAGYEYTKLYIFGDYLYYSTPNHLRDKSGTILSKYINIYRVRLDRAGDNDLIYSTDSENSSVSWSMHQVGDVAYMTILDGEKLVVVANDTKNSSCKKNIVEKEHVTSASLPTYSNSTDEVSAIDQKIYYTLENDEDTSTVVLKSYDLAKNESANVFSGTGESYEVKGTCGENLYYTKSVSGVNTKIYAYNFVSAPITVSDLAYGSSSSITSYALTGQKSEISIFYSDGSSTFYKIVNRATGESSTTKFLSSDIVSKIVKVQKNYVYYLSDSSLYRIDFTKTGQTGTKMIPSDVTPKADIVNNFSVDGDKVYFFVKYTNNYYLHYANYGTTMSDTDSSVYTHFVGKLLEEDYVDEE